jgi:MFS family permease
MDRRLFFMTLLQSTLTIFFFIMELVLLFSNPSDFPSVTEDYDIVYAGILFFVTSVFMLVGGFIIDHFKDLQKIQTISNLLSVALTLLAMFVRPVFVVVIIFIAVLTPVNILITMNIFMSQTSILNRGRYITILGLSLVLFIAPILYLIYMELNYPIVFAGVMISLTGTIFLWEKGYPIPNEVLLSRNLRSLPPEPSGVSQTNHEINSPGSHPSQGGISRMVQFLPNVTRNWIRAIYKTGFVPHLLLTMIGYFTSGFLVILLPETFTIDINFGLFAIILILFLIIKGILYDFYGRKFPIVAIIFILGIYLIFFNSSYPEWYQLFVIYSAPVIFVDFIMYSACTIGDFSNVYRRGRILSIMIFSSMISVFGGGLFANFLLILTDRMNAPTIASSPPILSMINILSVLILIGMMILIFTPETFDRAAINWRQYLDRLYILTKEGLNLCYHKFDRSKFLDLSLFDEPDPSQKMEPDRDLVSSGLTGIQALLKEIAQTKSELRVLDHSDRKIVFSHGQYTTIILIATTNLPIYHEMLQKFQDEFEFYNKEELASFSVMVPEWRYLPELLHKYFDVNPQTLNKCDLE